MESRVNTICIIIFAMLVFPASVLGNGDLFGIRTANLNGENIKTIYTYPYRQATHIRASPDGKWIMFSRYNDKDPKEGLAMENIGGKNHYQKYRTCSDAG